MSNRIPPWVITPSLILLSLGSIWVVGRTQMGSGAGQPKISVAPDEPPAPGDDGASPANTLPPPTPDTVFPDFSGTTTDGRTFRLSDTKGKVVLVNYWATWCGPCRMEIPDLIALQKKYGPRGFVVVGLSEDDKLSQAAVFVGQNGITYPVLQTPENPHQSVEVQGLPTSFLLNRQGMIVKSISGVSGQITPTAMWSPEIEKLL